MLHPQNDCLRTEVRSLFELNIFPKSFSFAEEAFNTGPPDAINLWIGDERSVSSMHKDYYENLFYVLSGEKVFTLVPPADLPFLYENEFDQATFHYVKGDSDGNDGHWVIVPDDELSAESTLDSRRTTRWIEPDISSFCNGDSQTKTKFPLLSRAHPIEVKVKAGEMLYLPSLWFHRVTQTCETVGINWWYDMKFDSKYVYFNLIQNISQANICSHCEEEEEEQ